MDRVRYRSRLVRAVRFARPFHPVWRTCAQFAYHMNTSCYDVLCQKCDATDLYPPSALNFAVLYCYCVVPPFHCDTCRLRSLDGSDDLGPFVRSPFCLLICFHLALPPIPLLPFSPSSAVTPLSPLALFFLFVFSPFAHACHLGQFAPFHSFAAPTLFVGTLF